MAYKDHELQEGLLKNSELDWTIVRPTGLTNLKLQEIQESFNNTSKPKILISRSSLAHYLVDTLTNPELINKTVTLSKK